MVSCCYTSSEQPEEVRRRWCRSCLMLGGHCTHTEDLGLEQRRVPRRGRWWPPVVAAAAAEEEKKKKRRTFSPMYSSSACEMLAT